MTEEKTVKHRKRLSLRERAEILRLADEKGPEVIVQSPESNCILLVKSFFVDRSCRTAKLRRNLKCDRCCFFCAVPVMIRCSVNTAIFSFDSILQMVGLFLKQESRNNKYFGAGIMCTPAEE